MVLHLQNLVKILSLIINCYSLNLANMKNRNMNFFMLAYFFYLKYLYIGQMKIIVFSTLGQYYREAKFSK